MQDLTIHLPSLDATWALPAAYAMVTVFFGWNAARTSRKSGRLNDSGEEKKLAESYDQSSIISVLCGAVTFVITNVMLYKAWAAASVATEVTQILDVIP